MISPSDKKFADYKESYLSLLENIFNEDVTISNSYSLNKYQLIVQEISPPIIKEFAASIPKKCLILYQPIEHEKTVEKNTFSSNSINESKDKKRSDSDTNIEFTGCPLEPSFDLTLHGTLMETSSPSLPVVNVSNKKYIAVPVTTARLFLSSYNTFINQKKIKRMLPLWIPCDGNDLKQTVWMGAYIDGSTNNRVIISCTGPSAKIDLPTMEKLKKNHLSSFPNLNTEPTTEVFATYTVTDGENFLEMSNVTSIAENGKEMPIIIQCTWEKAAQILDVPSDDVKCKILLKLVPSYSKSSACVIFEDLELIKTLILHKSNVAIWPSRHSDYHEYEMLFTSHIKKLMESLKYRTFRKNIADSTLSSTKDIDYNLESVLVGNRRDNDFTDELWDVLKRCSSTQELKVSLVYIMDVIKRGEVQPMIFRNNTTTIGKISMSMEGGHSISILEPNAVLDLLLEIGMEKLRRDFIYIFVQHELAKQDQVYSFVRTCEPSLKSVTDLEKLFCVLKLVSICLELLHLPKSIINTYIRDTLNYYQSVEEIDVDHMFCFIVPYTHVRKLINSLQPSDWQISFKTNDDSFHSHSVCLFSTNSPYSHVQKLSDSFPCGNNLEYFCTIGHLYQD